MEQNDPNAPQDETKDDDSPVAAVDCPSKLAFTNYQNVSKMSAAKIVGMEMTTTGASLTLEGNDAPLAVDSVFIADHKPAVGQYLVVDDDGMSVVTEDYMSEWEPESQDAQPEGNESTSEASTGQSGTSENQQSGTTSGSDADAAAGNTPDPEAVPDPNADGAPKTGEQAGNTPDPAAGVDGDGNPNPPAQ